MPQVKLGPKFQVASESFESVDILTLHVCCMLLLQFLPSLQPQPGIICETIFLNSTYTGGHLWQLICIEREKLLFLHPKEAIDEIYGPKWIIGSRDIIRNDRQSE